MKVSVIVPVYNPGEHFDPCVDSLLGQSMAPSEHELIFVDDGSTDGTGARLDALAEGHPHVRVRHIPNSGWPGRPRNVGLEMAGGEFVYFVDNDDWLGREALERLYGAAVEGDADVVVGKVVGHRRWVPRGIFRRNVHGLTVEEAPFGLLTPHKLFRRAVLEQHGIRFPEGRRSLEDHPFVVMAYFRARRISILADYPCYHWVNHGRETNASLAPPDPASYFASVRTVLDLLDAETEPGELRDRLYMRWYRGKLLGRLNGRQFQRNEEAYMRRVLEEVRALVVERFPAHLDEALTLRDRLRAQLIRRGSFDGLRALADFETALRAEARARRSSARRRRSVLAHRRGRDLAPADGARGGPGRGRARRHGGARTAASPRGHRLHRRRRLRAAGRGVSGGAGRREARRRDAAAHRGRPHPDAGGRGRRRAVARALEGPGQRRVRWVLRPHTRASGRRSALPAGPTRRRVAVAVRTAPSRATRARTSRRGAHRPRAHPAGRCAR
jgi:glycosyltransferase involved in cell wall biosynthesis